MHPGVFHTNRGWFVDLSIGWGWGVAVGNQSPQLSWTPSHSLLLQAGIKASRGPGAVGEVRVNPQSHKADPGVAHLGDHLPAGLLPITGRPCLLQAPLSAHSSPPASWPWPLCLQPGRLATPFRPSPHASSRGGLCDRGGHQNFPALCSQPDGRLAS